MSLETAHGYVERTNLRIAAALLQAIVRTGMNTRQKTQLLEEMATKDAGNVRELLAVKDGPMTRWRELSIASSSGDGGQTNVPTVADCLEHAKFLVSKGRGMEAAKLILPRLEAQKRRANKEKRTRVQFDCDEQIYSDFHAERQRYIEACGNHPLIAYAIMIRLLQQLPAESIAKLAADEQSEEKGSLADA